MSAGTVIEPKERAQPGWRRAASAWLATQRLGLAVMALVVGLGAGLGAAGFRWLVFGVTWLVTGHEEFGQQGHAPSIHLPFLGIFFVLVVPSLGGLIYGPLIYRYAREARGHGVPEVMLAVAENGGRIRPAVVVVKALASAITIGTGGSVGREGPIVQIGSALASTLGQLVGTSQGRLRIIVACGAAGGISATFNAPITGLFFGFEIVLREFSLDALFATSLAAVSADVVSRAFFGSAPFFAGVPHNLAITNDFTYLLIALLALIAGLLGLGFKTVLYGMEDWADRIWHGPEWARPVVGGVGLGLILLALPQMYGVGYPVMDRVIAGHVVLGLVLLFLLGKVVATSLTLSIGGSGGVFAPSLFIGAMAGMAFGVGVHDLFGPQVGPPALYAVVAMGGVFAGAAQAPLTAIASVAEMTGNFALTLPVMLMCAISAAVSKQLSYGSVYTTKLLRRGIDIERPRPAAALQMLRVADAMRPLDVGAAPPTDGAAEATEPPATVDGPSSARDWDWLTAAIVDVSDPQELYAEETLEQALRQLTVYGRAGLPVVSQDRERVQGWLSRQAILRTLAEQIDAAQRSAVPAAMAAEFASADPLSAAHRPTRPLDGYKLVELAVDSSSSLVGVCARNVRWPAGATPVAVVRGVVPLQNFADSPLRMGDRVSLIARDAPALSAGSGRDRAA